MLVATAACAIREQRVSREGPAEPHAAAGGNSGAAATEGLGDGEACKEHRSCASGVCARYYKDAGKCAPVSCRTGDKADNNHFFCSLSGRWEPSRTEGTSCRADYECFEPTCFMKPACLSSPVGKGVCRNGVCALDTSEDECVKQGLTRVLAPEGYWLFSDGHCSPAPAGFVLDSVCVPCGNGTCDAQESRCNCPQDCPGTSPPKE
jgi:hypothetical protein